MDRHCWCIGQRLGENRVSRPATEIEYLRPFVLGDTVEASVRIDALGRTSMTERFELAHAETGALHAVVTMTIVNVHLLTGRPAPIEGEVRAFPTALMVAQPDRVA